MSSPLIPPSSTILIIDNKGARKFAQLENANFVISKRKVDLSFFVGKTLNSFWDVTDDEYKEVSESEFLSSANSSKDEEMHYNNNSITSPSNMNFFQLSENQKLSREEIEEMRRKGGNEEEIIKALMENSLNLRKRNVMSKDKYIKKKFSKYKHFLFLCESTVQAAAESLFIAEPRELNFLRFDSFGTILQNSNFEGSSLIIGFCPSLLLLAFAKRTRSGRGVVRVEEEGKITSRNLNLLTFMSSKEYDLISFVSSSFLLNKEKFLWEKWKGKFRNFVFCVKEEKNVIKDFCLYFRFLCFSGNIIVYCRNKETLISLDKYLSSNSLCVDGKIIQTTVREYQLLDLRTHPIMNQKMNSGFVFVGYKNAKDI